MKNSKTTKTTTPECQIVGIIDPSFERENPRHLRVFVSVVVRDGMIFGNGYGYGGGAVQECFGFQYDPEDQSGFFSLNPFPDAWEKRFDEEGSDDAEEEPLSEEANASFEALAVPVNEWLDADEATGSLIVREAKLSAFSSRKDKHLRVSQASQELYDAVFALTNADCWPLHTKPALE